MHLPAAAAVLAAGPIAGIEVAGDHDPDGLDPARHVADGVQAALGEHVVVFRTRLAPTALLQPEELEPLVVFVIASRHGGKIAPPAAGIARRPRFGFTAATAAPVATAVTGGRTSLAGRGWRAAFACNRPAFRATAAPSSATAAASAVVVAAGRRRPISIGSRFLGAGRPHAIAGREGFIVDAVAGDAVPVRPDTVGIAASSAVAGRFRPVAITAAPAAATAATTAATAARPLAILVRFRRCDAPVAGLLIPRFVSVGHRHRVAVAVGLEEGIVGQAVACITVTAVGIGSQAAFRPCVDR